jgi:hypothetical protein
MLHSQVDNDETAIQRVYLKEVHTLVPISRFYDDELEHVDELLPDLSPHKNLDFVYDIIKCAM